MGARRHSMRLSTRLLLVVLTCLLAGHRAGRMGRIQRLGGAPGAAWRPGAAAGATAERRHRQHRGGRAHAARAPSRSWTRCVTPRRRCGERLRATQHSVPMFAFVALLDADGNLICASEPALGHGRGRSAAMGRGMPLPPRASRPAVFATVPGVSGGFLPFALPLAAVVSGSQRRAGGRPRSRPPVGTPGAAQADRIAIPGRQRAHRSPIVTASSSRAAPSMRSSSASGSHRMRWPW